jgi:hypothetical protein
MSRTRKAAMVGTPVAEATPETAPAVTLAAQQAPAGEAGGESTATRGPRQHAREAVAGERAYPADPNEKISVSLSDVPGGPAMHLLRSHKFKHYARRMIMCS